MCNPKKRRELRGTRSILNSVCQPDTGRINKERSQIQKNESAQSNVASSFNRKEDNEVPPEDNISNYSRSS